MNRSAEILEYLASPNTANFVLLAPRAPPVTRGPRGVEVALNVVLDADDVTDTLDALAREAGHEVKADGRAGTFAFGRKGAGRLRVMYATQRGSRVLTVELIASAIPPLDKICSDTAAAERILRVLAEPAPGVVAVTGPSARHTGALVYSLLARLNEDQRQIVFILERRLRYLMGHGSSVVVQAEVGTDVPSMEAGLNIALNLEPGILFVGDLWPSDEVPSLSQAAGSGLLTVVASSSLGAEAIFLRCGAGGSAPAPLAPSRRLGVVAAEPLPDGQLQVSFDEGAPQAGAGGKRA